MLYSSPRCTPAGSTPPRPCPPPARLGCWAPSRVAVKNLAKDGQLTGRADIAVRARSMCRPWGRLWLELGLVPGAIVSVLSPRHFPHATNAVGRSGFANVRHASASCRRRVRNSRQSGCRQGFR
eukprot:1176635-Prorocentrum_minimum.AAC.4